MELIEFGRLSEAQYAELVGDEDDPWDAEGSTLQWRPKDHHVGVRDHDGRLLAAAGLVVADVRFGEASPIAVVGIGGVIVAAAYRGRGLGRQVISEVVRRADDLGPAMAMLFCRPDRAGLYRRHGFAVIPSQVIAEQEHGLVEMPPVTMWRPLNDDARLEAGVVALLGRPF